MIIRNTLLCSLLCWTLLTVGHTQHFQQIEAKLERKLQSLLLPDLSELIKQVLSENVGNSSTCEAKLSSLATKLTLMDPESIAFFDSAGRPAPGLTKGNVLMMGSYDSCKELQNATKGYYQPCTVTLPATLAKVYPISIVWTGCIPLECRGKGNFTVLKNDFASNVAKYSGGLISINASTITQMCEEKNTYDAGAYVGIVVLSIIGFFVLVGTLWYLLEPIVESILDDSLEDKTVLVDCEENVYETADDGIVPDKPKRLNSVQAHEKSDKPESIIGKVFKCFSLQRTFEALLNSNTKQGQVLCLNGIRVLSINWVVLGHSYMSFMYLTGDVEYISTLLYRKNFTFIFNGMPSVDSFFTLSGFLVSLLLLRQLTKHGNLSITQWFAYYVHRYVRLTIPYLVVILMEGFLYRLYVSGPNVFEMEGEHKSCKDYWWTNLLYINNMVPWKATEQCVGQTWYLANDMQFFVIAPIFVVLLYTIPLAGIISTVSAIVCSAVAALVITDYYDLGPQSGLDANPDDFWLLYNKPWIRITPYLVGILGGYLYWSWGEQITSRVSQLKEWNKVLVGIPIWAITAGIEYAVVFGLHDDIIKNLNGKHIPQADSISYQSLSRTAWGLALTTQILACQCGLGGFINSILSWKGWVVLSRLTYSVYLLHIGLMLIVAVQMRHTFFINPDYEFAIWYLGVLGMSYLAGACLFTCIEQPIASLESMTYRKQKQK